MHNPTSLSVIDRQPAPVVHGLSVTQLTQCAHWSSSLDVIAIKHACCGKFYACASCHDALEGHPPRVWSKDKRTEEAVLCGRCKKLLAIEEYMGSGSKCPACGAGFNPGCKNHWRMYFEVDERDVGRL